MRTGVELVRATSPFARDNPWLSWWHVLSTTALALAAYAGTLWNLNLGLKLACSVLAGLLTVRLFVIYHDQQHHAILPKSRVADVYMRIFGILAITPSSVWRSSHDYHHKHNSKLKGAHIGSFPVMTKTQYEHSSPARRLRYLIARHPLTIGLGYLSMFLYGMCVNPFLTHPKKHFDGLVAMVVHVAWAVTLVRVFGWTALILTQTLPHLITFGIGSYLFYAQHNFTGVILRDSQGWAYEKAAMESSSFIKTNPVMAWFTANIGYHHIHHLNHRIPFYRLPEVFQAIPELQHPTITTLAPTQIVRCLKLKLWDTEAQQMVPLGTAN